MRELKHLKEIDIFLEILKQDRNINLDNFLNNLKTLKIYYVEDDEKEIYLRGRNSKIHTVHKDLASYHKATGFEALIGYLYLLNKNERLEEIIDIVKGL